MTMLGRAAILMLAILLVPGLAAAALLGDTVSATLTDLDTSTVIFSGSVVVGAGVEFSSVAFGDETWSLDLSDAGFSPLAACPADSSSECDHFIGASPATSGLDFTPPAILTGLMNPSGDLAFDNPTVVAAGVGLAGLAPRRPRG